MATSYTSGAIYDTNGAGRHIYVTCSQTKGTSSENRSIVNWTLVSTGGGTTYFDTGPTNLWIDGVNRYSLGRVYWSSASFPAAPGSVSGSFVKYHNTDGSVPGMEVSLSTAIVTASVSSTTGTWYMDSIARFFSNTPSITLLSKTETSMDFRWDTSEICSNVEVHYKKENETNYTIINKYNDNNTGATSGTFSLTDLTENTKYNIYIIAKRKDSGLTSNSSTSTFDTYSYPKITSVGISSIYIGTEQSLEIYNPLKRNVVIEMRKTNADGEVLYTSPSLTETYYKFTPDTSTLYESIPNAQFAECVYSVICSEVKSTKTTGKYSYKIIGDEKPIFDESQVSTYDASPEVTAITEQTAAGGWLVQSLSKMKLTIDSAAIPQHSAEIASYRVLFNNEIQILSVGETGGVWDPLNNSGNQTATIEVTDSRGLTTIITKTIEYKPYKVPSITLTGGRKDNYGETVNLTATYRSSSVETKNKITITWSGAEKSGILIDAGDADNGSMFTSITGVDNNTAYDFTAIITDSFGKTANAILPISIGMPIMFVDSNQLGVGVNTFPKGEGLWVKGQVDISGNLKAQEIKTLRLNPTNDVERFISFARLNKINETGRGAMTFLISALGKYDGAIPGTCLVTFSNRGSIPTVKASWLQNNNSGDIQFGYYDSGDYYYLGIHINDNSYSGDITLLSSDVSDIAGGSQEVKIWSSENVAPIGWTSIIPTDSGISKLDAWPIHSIYFSYNDTSPASLFGGTWEAITGDYYLMLSDSASTDRTGGSNSTSYTPSGTVEGHQLTINEIPRHNHLVTNSTTTYGPGTQDAWRCMSFPGTNHDYWQNIWSGDNGGGGSHSHGFTGTAATITINPKYYKVYAWRRVG